MSRRYFVLAAALAACHGTDPAPTTPARVTMAAPAPRAARVIVADSKQQTQPAPPAKDPGEPGGHDFTAIGKQLLAVGACGGGTELPEGMTADMIEKHCEVIRGAQNDYLEKWVKPAHAFFAEKVPKTAPKKVVYPFAGGDLSTALTVYPDADEITTISLEPAGDPRTLSALATDAAARSKTGKVAKAPRLDPRIEKALGTIQYELKFLYRVNFSNTLNMIDAMRGGALPTQLIFGLSALKIHGYEVVSLRYFRLETDGAIHYLDDDEVAKAPDPLTTAAQRRNQIFANAEIRFRKPGGRVQIYRHLQGNLGNNEAVGGLVPLKKDPRILKHLESKGPIAGMTKAASYLLSWDSFSMIRDYLIGHVQWMVSDATGVAPKWGKPAGFEYETYGGFDGPHIPAGSGIAKDWRDEFNAQGKRELGFRFGYYDRRNVNHLVIMRKKP